MATNSCDFMFSFDKVLFVFIEFDLISNLNVNVYLLFDCIRMVGRLCTWHLVMAKSQCPRCWCG